MIVGGDIQWKRDECYPLAIGRDVWKPVVEGIVGDLLLGASIGPHAPDLHPSAARRVEVDVRAVAHVLRSVVESRGGGEADLVATGDGNLVNIEIVVALPNVNQPASVW